MAKKNGKPKDQKKVEEKKEKKESWTIAQAFRELAPKGAKSKDALSDGIIDLLTKKGISEIRGKALKKENVISQVNAICRDIGTKEKAGAKTRGWWTKYTVIESDDKFIVEEKAQN